MSETQFADTGDRVIAAARQMSEGLTLPQVHRAQQYAKLYAKWKLEEVAMHEHRQGRHTLAQSLITKAEEIVQ